MKILTVVGTRPNFIKVTQFKKWLDNPARGLEHKLVHTGQHFDYKMAKSFFEQFDLKPDYFLELIETSPGSVIGEIIVKLTKLFKEEKPDLVLVIGDVNSTLAAAIAAQKNNIKIGHIESGLRSNDRSMPEEINRILTDEITDYYFVTEESGRNNLVKEGKAIEKIFYVGNTMIDTLVSYQPKIDQAQILEDLNISNIKYTLVTMHRPATVDNKEGLHRMLEILKYLTQKNKVVFPIHPRTKAKLKEFSLETSLNLLEGVICTDPLDYFNFQHLIKNADFVVTDSGGIQEETTYYKVPCLTLRPNTERPSTIEVGSNNLCDIINPNIFELVDILQTGKDSGSSIPEKWDGMATQRIRDIILNLI